jgi:hypothetical protein
VGKRTATAVISPSPVQRAVNVEVLSLIGSAIAGEASIAIPSDSIATTENVLASTHLFIVRSFETC